MNDKERIDLCDQWYIQAGMPTYSALSARVAELQSDARDQRELAKSWRETAETIAEQEADVRAERDDLRAQLAEAQRQEPVEISAPHPDYAEHIRFEGRDCVVLCPEHYEEVYFLAVRNAVPVPAQPSAFTPEECATIRAYVGTNLQNIGGPDGSILDRFAATALSLLEMPK